MLLQSRLTILGFLAVVVGATSIVFGADSTFWPRFHGPKGDNISAATGLLKQWPEEGPRLIWTAEGIGNGFSGVTLANRLIFTAGNMDEKTVVTALDMNGRIRWQAENGTAWISSHPGTRGTPTIDGNRLYHESPLGEVVCLDAKTGKRIWGLNILEKFHSKNITWGLAESLTVDGNRLICCPGGPETAVVALDKRTGRTIWKSPTADGDLIGYATPTIAECRGLRMVLTMTLKALIGVNADTGDLLFRFAHPAKNGVNAMKPLYHDGHVLISSDYGTTGTTLVKLEVKGSKTAAVQVWNSREMDNHHGGIILWDGYLYGAGHNFNNGKWVCLDWKTGEKKYAERGVGKGSLTCADGLLYTMSEKRVVGLVEPNPDGHRLISKFKIPSGGEGPTWAHPVVCGGRLYIRHADFLYAFDVRAQ